MGPLRYFLFVYIFGGLTFVPVVLGLILLFAYLTLPDISRLPPKPPANDPAQLVRDTDLTSSDEKLAFKTGTDDLVEKFHRKHDSDVAAGYFAVCREYVPGGVNGKPPDKLSPAGEVVAQESPSVYQSMYRSIFDRSQKPTIEPNKESTGRSIKKANNVFYVVLRHGHLMLYDDIQQLEVRYVISLEYHDVDIYGGEGEPILEAELWMKRNAIRMKRKPALIGDKAVSLPFFFFSENLSEKEDFYHAILRNQEKNIIDPPIPQEFDTGHIITLVQKLHSSEEQLQTRWINALLGRLFLALYKTPFVEQRIRQKLTKKISRVKKPNFITKLALQKIDLGEGAPFITNPRLRDLTVNGDCLVEADIDYTGNARIEIAATARIDLGSRFKAREVDMVLAATCKKLQGRMLLRLKPPPSNRLWFTFEKMPKIDMTLEPIVSTRQITYTVILKAIESRILEVIAETIVLPFWDDTPFLDTINEKYRGGVWKKESVPTPPTEIKNETPEDEAEAGGESTSESLEPMKKSNRNMSMPVLADRKDTVAMKAAAKKSVSSLREVLGSHSPPRSPALPPRAEAPRVLRSSSFASVVDPALSPTHADGNTPAWDIKAGQKRDSMLKDLSQRSLGSSPTENISTSLPTESTVTAEIRERTGSIASKASLDSTGPKAEQRTSFESRSTVGSTVPNSISSIPRSDTMDTRTSGISSTSNSSQSKVSINEHDLSNHGNADAANGTKIFGAGSLSDRKQTIASVSAAASAAQKWGWGVIARNRQRDEDGHSTHEHEATSSTTLPMGRGQPLPPPGTPLPHPAKPSLFSLPKRKPHQGPPPLPKRASDSDTNGDSASGTTTPNKPPALPDRPERRRRQASLANNVSKDQEEELLVVEAPAESTPSTPMNEHHDDFFGHGEIGHEDSMVDKSTLSTEKARKPPPLPFRKEVPKKSSFDALKKNAAVAPTKGLKKDKDD